MPQLGEARCAMVVRPDDPAGYGMCRMLEILTEERNPSLTLRTFTDIGEAEQWLPKRDI